MKKRNHVIGLFRGTFQKHTLTFNPGWDNEARELQTHTDVREIQLFSRKTALAGFGKTVVPPAPK